LLFEDERDIALEVVTRAFSSHEEKTKTIAVRALSIPGVA
jgi:hypothetical protein